MKRIGNNMSDEIAELLKDFCKKKTLHNIKMCIPKYANSQSNRMLKIRYRNFQIGATPNQKDIQHI